MTTPDDEGFGRIFDAKQGGDIDYLLRALTDPIHRSTAARYLGQLNAVAAIPQLIRLLDADQQDVRTAATQALGDLRAADAVPRLIEVATTTPRMSLAPSQSGEGAGNPIVVIMLRLCIRG